MGIFHNWLKKKQLLEQEDNKVDTPLTRKTEAQVAKVYKALVKNLGMDAFAGDRAGLNIQIGQLKSKPQNGQPPKQGDVSHFQQGLDHVRDIINGIQDTELQTRFNDVATNLAKYQREPVARVLDRIFGEKSVETYGKEEWKHGATKAEKQQPQPGQGVAQPSTSPPMSQEPGAPQMPPAGPDMAGGMPPPDMGAMPPDMAGGMPPMPGPGMPPDMGPPMGGIMPPPPPGAGKMPGI